MRRLFSFLDNKKYRRKKENDSKHLWLETGIGVVLEKDAQSGGEVLKHMEQFKLKIFKMHPARMKKFLLLNTCTPKESNGDRWTTAWYSIDLSKIRCEGDNWVTGKMDIKIKMPQKFSYPRMCVALGSVIYIISGDSSFTNIYYSDTTNPKNEWYVGSYINLHREIVSAVVHDEKIYIFGGFVDDTRHFGQVYDPMLNSWEPISDPPKELGRWRGTFGGMYRGRKILVHPCSNGVLYAYDVVDRSWEVLDHHFGCWQFHGVIVDDVLYVFDYMNAEICGYDLDQSKWLKPINLDCLEWFPRNKNSKNVVLDDALFFEVGAKMLCLVYIDWKRGGGLDIYCKTFTIKKITQEDDDVVLEAEVFSSTIYNLEEVAIYLNYVVM